jgi:hypothetical protein
MAAEEARIIEVKSSNMVSELEVSSLNSDRHDLLKNKNKL